jgi:hypothetical protein
MGSDRLFVVAVTKKRGRREITAAGATHCNSWMDATEAEKLSVCALIIDYV